MSWTRHLIVLLVGICVHADLASAQALEFRSIDQSPGMVDQNATTIAVANIGTVALNIMYLDGDWKAIQIPSGKYVTLPSQGASLSVSFNDGVEAKSVNLNRGTAYALYWNSGINRWAIAPYDEVARRPSGLRSR